MKKDLTLNVDDIDKLKLLFFSKKDNYLNPYINKYNSYELDLEVLENNNIRILFSKYGLLTINNAALKQSIEIVEDEELMILELKNQLFFKEVKRILVELPGLKDPERIKKSSGKNCKIEF